LNEFTLLVPPLRERREDIVYLAQRFLEMTNAELQKNLTGFSESAVQAMLAHSWPGNVRELRSCIRRAVLLADDVITEKHLDLGRTTPEQPPAGGSLPEENQEDQPLKEIVRRHIVRVEREIILRMLQRTGGNKAKAARLLQIDYKTMHSKIREYGLALDRKEKYEPKESKG
jgi:two-component system nitrogen regulation response regulator GlnG